MIPGDPLQQLRDLDRASPQFHEQLSNFLHGNDENLAWCMDSVVVGIPNPASVPFQESLHELRKICGVNGMLPKSCTLSESLLRCVYEGTFGGSKVRIRRVRMYPGGSAQDQGGTFHQVAVMWKHLAHPNIVPPLSVTIDPFELISDRIPGRDLTEYITNHPDADRLFLLSDVAEGLDYLHSCNVIYGNLKGTLDGRETYSKEADVFSFAGVAIEAFTGAAPFSDKPPRTTILAIWDIFTDRNETEEVRRLRGDDAQSPVDVIDEMLDLVPSLRTQCLSALCRICGRQALLPRSVKIPFCFNQTDMPLYEGGFTNVWKGRHQEREVAVKITRRFCKEVMEWKSLCHPNVLPLLGVTMGNRRFAMASEWMADRNINEFVKEWRDANRFELLADVARELVYMHGEGIIHGDLKGANILIDKRGHACLADLGLMDEPELLNPDQFGFKDGRPTKESDSYALGVVILNGQALFASYKDLIVLAKVVGGEHPGRPDGAKGALFTDDLWGILELCWSAQPTDRLDIKAVLGHLEQASTTWQPLIRGDVETDDDDESFFTVTHYRMFL
ncbi:kinase-like protein [Thelephora ganbajun]|uniref:Kinase-like protein n=1 Tax=Thelephora ganbajun TaxID=370292 RepID=A0ACB6Z0C0_THEGA|nr:kinase-like protein [Thelephora ganbajun]